MKAEKFQKVAAHQKKWYGKWHTWAGLCSGAILLVVTLTGALLVYEEELDVYFNPELFTFEEASGEMLSFEEALRKVESDHPKYKLDGLYQQKGRNNAYMAYMEESKEQLVINPYTGKLMGTRIYAESLMGFIRTLHRTLLIPDVEKYIVGTASFVMVILMITGLRLWLPKKISQLKARLGHQERSKHKKAGV